MLTFGKRKSVCEEPPSSYHPVIYMYILYMYMYISQRKRVQNFE